MCEFCSQTSQVTDRIEELKAEITRLRETLEWIAEYDNCSCDESAEMKNGAKAALQGKPEKGQ